MKELNFYHYTIESRIDEIIESGEIRLASKSTYAKKEKPVAWVSSNEHWENTATKMIMTYSGTKELTFEEQLELHGCGRIEVKNSGLMTWAKLKHKANMDFHMAGLMENAGIRKGGKPSEWFGSLLPIKMNDWIKAELYKNGKWEVYKVFNQK